MFRKIVVAIALLVAVAIPNAQAATPDPVACTGYPEPRIYLETQSWWEPVPGLNTQGHVHMGVCWPDRQVVSGTLRLDIVGLFHLERGKITQFKVQDDLSTDFISAANIAVDSSTYTGSDPTVIRTMSIDTTKMPDGLRQLRIYIYFTHPNGNSQRTKAMYRVRVNNVPGTTGEIGPKYSEYGGAGWYKEADGTDWGYQTATLKSGSFPGVACVPDIWKPVVDTDPSGTTEHLVTIDPHFHDGDQGRVVHRSTTAGYEGPVVIDTSTLSIGWHKLVIQSARRVGSEENGGVFLLPFRVC